MSRSSRPWPSHEKPLRHAGDTRSAPQYLRGMRRSIGTAEDARRLLYFGVADSCSLHYFYSSFRTSAVEPPMNKRTGPEMPHAVDLQDARLFGEGVTPSLLGATNYHCVSRHRFPGAQILTVASPINADRHDRLSIRPRTTHMWAMTNPVLVKVSFCSQSARHGPCCRSVGLPLTAVNYRRDLSGCQGRVLPAGA